MSKRLLQRGRYPKAPGVDQITTPSPQFPQSSVPQCPTPSNIPYTSVQSESAQNAWNHPSYPNQSSYQQNQSMSTIAQPNEYWSAGQMYSMPMQPPVPNESWNWKPETTESTNFPSYHQPQQPVIPPPESWQQVQYSDVGNQNYINQPIVYNSAPQEYQPPIASHSVNSNVERNKALETSGASLDTSLQQWDGSNLIEPENLHWTYSAPKYEHPPTASNPVQPEHLSWTYSTTQYDNLSTSLNPDYVVNSTNSSWPNNTVCTSSSEMYNNMHYLPSDSSTLNGHPLGPQNVVDYEDKVADSFNCDNKESGRESSVDPEYGNSALSAFFHNSAENSSRNSVCDESPLPPNLKSSAQDSAHNSEYRGTSTPEVKNISDSFTLEDKMACLQIHESEVSSIKAGDEQNVENTNVENQEMNFVQEQNSYKPEIVNHSNSGSSLGFVEEPVNQEVPEPRENHSVSPQLHSNQDFNELPHEEPLNQQVPVESCETSRSSSSERERVVIRPREESPFKPPRISNTTSTVVQHELPMEDTKQTVQTEEKTIIHEVNLETVPDNLERPPDHDELRKQSLYVSHQRHLRTELNNSPSSLLCSNPDIPCVTLAPAAPPLHSSARSDKSESSSDSRREMTAYENPTVSRTKLKETSNRSSPLATVSEANKLPNDQSFPPSSDFNIKPSTQSEGISESHPQKPNPEQYESQMHSYLKESRIDDVHHQELPRHTRDPNPIENFTSGPKHVTYSKPRADPRYPSYSEAEYSRQRFAEKKYPSFDERQYYSDRERSRPSSRTSLDDRSEEYMYRRRPEEYPYPANGDRRHGPSEYGRPPSRSSESDLNRSDRHYYDYKQQQYPYPAEPYARNPDYYNRQPNYRGYEYDPYQRDPYYASYYDAYRYAYSNYNYGFYDELYRNDPRYAQYREQYRQYYAKYGYEGDYERSSVHSGRSSTNELIKDSSSSNRYPEPDLDSNVSEISAYNIRQDYSYEDVPKDSLSTAGQSTPSTRLTPVKYSYAHPIAKFSAGGLLITAIPSQADPTMPASVRIQNMQMIMENEESYNELKNHQGPLIRGLTHKNDVVEFCNQKIKNLRLKENVIDRDSYILLWELMVLLLRQNGSVAGSDIAELLLKDHEVLRPHIVPLRQTLETPIEQLPADVNDSSSQSHAGDTSSPDEGIVVLHDKTILNPPKTVDIDKITRKFREFLLFGHKKDALEWAMKHGLWGHALFLASKMELRTYANVMTRFANSLALNDPLQTLYQLMSGRQPSAVTCVADKKWGDWRPHLAMILSNPSSMPDVDSRSITTLGDTLASSGCLPAAQFCYIMAQVEFGTFEQKNSKLVLLTADHRLSFEEFATNEAIQCTEIYEYAQSLANPGYLLVHLQMYKYLYALRLVEHGFLEEALHYCEVIACNLQNLPTLFTFDLISEVFKLSSSLKYHDPHFLRGQGEYEDQDDPEWLKNLSILVQNYHNIMQMQQNAQVQYETADISQPVAEQFPPVLENIAEALYQDNSSTVQNDIPNESSNANFYQMNNWNQPNTMVPQPPSLSNNHQDKPVYYNDVAQSNYKMENNLPNHEENDTTDAPSSPVTQTPPFDYYSGSTQQDMRQSNYEPMNNYSISSNHRERRDSALSSSSRYSAGSTSVANKHPVTSNKDTTKPELKKESKPSSQAGKTWLGGIFSRLLPRAPNQMILPDDKNPTIVWDEVQKRWVNKDSNDEDENNAPLAPPTDMELMGSMSSNKPVVPPGNSAPPNASSPVNKFQRPKTRGMRQNYVDVLNNSGATTKTNVPPEAVFSSPFDHSNTTNMFIPAPAPVRNENSEMEAPDASFAAGLENEGQSQVMSSPLMFDPAEFDSRRSGVANQRFGMGRTGRRTYPS